MKTSKIRSAFLLLLLCAAVCLFTVPAFGECAHESTEERIALDPTCTEKGALGLFCTICGEQIKDYFIPVEPLGHDYQLVILRERTCTQFGEAYEKCSRCGIRGMTVTEAVTGHIAGTPVQENYSESSCTKDGGYDQVVYCSVCHEVMERNHVRIPATGHVPDSPVQEDFVEDSCVQNGGYYSAVYCRVCGEIIERKFISIGVGGHDLGSSYVYQQPTCQNEGILARDCRNCGYTEYTRLEKTDHLPGKSVDEKVVKPTCTEYGSYEHVTYCGVCGTVMERLECNWKALGHDWGEWVTVQKATYDEKGMMQRVCLRNASHVEECEVEKRIRYTITEGAPSEDSDSVPPPFKKTETDDHGDVASHFTELKYDGQRLTKDKYYTVK